MKRLAIAGLLGATVALTAGAAAGGGQAPPPPTPTVKVGDAAPDFTLPYLEATAEGKVASKEMKLSDFKGKSVVVLAFFPAAFSPG
ncbi:MAG: redoxin domain-containing protein [Acidobacteria bacterium]|nr:redoxin domain-containing protein [Acidobacteriota bacterium]MBI3263861.1 redoxin domain-containing protein [Acidobacteriota bacterium]